MASLRKQWSNPLDAAVLSYETNIRDQASRTRRGHTREASHGRVPRSGHPVARHAAAIVVVAAGRGSARAPRDIVRAGGLIVEWPWTAGASSGTDEEWQEADVLWPDMGQAADEPRVGGWFRGDFVALAGRRAKPCAGWRPAASSPIDIPACCR